MPVDEQIHHRRSLRLPGYDYSLPGAYFVTLVTWQRAWLFGEIVNDKMILNPVGKVVKSEWQKMAHRFPFLRLEAFGMMPNHIHGIIMITEAVRRIHEVTSVRTTQSQDAIALAVGATRAVPEQIIFSNNYLPDKTVDNNDGSPLHPGDGSSQPRVRPNGPAPYSVGAFIGQFKSRVTKRLHRDPKFPAVNIWQRNYYEHIIRNEDEWERIHLYIIDNPRQWAEDEEHV